jgi:Zn-dependent M28 family amino/carboxypeptidase
MNLSPRRVWVVLLTVALLLGAVVGVAWTTMMRMPGQSHAGDLEPWTPADDELAERLEGMVVSLAEDIGPRHLGNIASYRQAQRFIEETFSSFGYEVMLQETLTGDIESYNLEVEVPGGSRAEEIVVIGAHYDTVPGSPGANDNATGVAATLVLAEAFRGSAPQRTLRFVTFANEEQPFFQTPAMGSYQYAKRASGRGESIVGMLSLETMGYFSDEPDSQRYPFPVGLFYPSTGNFIAFVGNLDSAPLLRQVVGGFRVRARIPSEGAALPDQLPGVGWSDHWSFWQFDYPAIMVTDTAIFRYPYYHHQLDLPRHLDYHRLARVVMGLRHAIDALANPD